jgi:hypothetical protein
VWILAVLLAFITCPSSLSAQEAEAALRVIHVFVALCDNVHQGIVPVPAALGNGDDPKNNLYWGAMHGVKTFLRKSPHWRLLATIEKPSPPPRPGRRTWLSRFRHTDTPILERCIFQHAAQRDVYLVADAYQGRQIKQTVVDFLYAASGTIQDTVIIQQSEYSISLPIYGRAHLLSYVGHDGLMDFSLRRYPTQQDTQHRDTIILACLSQKYFSEPIMQSGATPLIWTTGLMSPEAYTLESALEGWIARESPEQIRMRAASAYHKYQQCGVNAAKRLLITGF